MNLSKILASVTIPLLGLATITGITAVLSRTEATAGTCTRAPCAGYSYEVVYKQSSGAILAIRGWDPTASDPSYGASFVLQPGEDSALVPADNAIGDILNNSNDKDYAFDTNTRQIKRVAGASGVDETAFGLVPSPLGDSESVAVLSLALTLCTSVASVAVRKRSGPK